MAKWRLPGLKIRIDDRTHDEMAAGTLTSATGRS
jgi:hypothetical protein